MKISSKLGCGGIIRGEVGEFVYGFISPVDDGDHLKVELWECLLGLKMAWNIGLKSLILELIH